MCWHFLNVLPLNTTDSTEQKPMARTQWEELMFWMESACYRSLKYKLGRGSSGVVHCATPRRTAPAVRLCDSYSSPHCWSGVHSKQLTKLPSLEHFTTTSSYLRGRHHPFGGSLHRAEGIFKSHRSLSSVAMQGGYGAKHFRLILWRISSPMLPLIKIMFP